MKAKLINDNIKNYSNYKIITTLKKKGSPLSIVFLTNDPDEWFLEQIIYVTKSGKINERNTIIAKDLPGFIEFYEHDGYQKV